MGLSSDLLMDIGLSLPLSPTLMSRSLLSLISTRSPSLSPPLLPMPPPPSPTLDTTLDTPLSPIPRLLPPLPPSPLNKLDKHETLRHDNKLHSEKIPETRCVKL